MKKKETEEKNIEKLTNISEILSEFGGEAYVSEKSETETVDRKFAYNNLKGKEIYNKNDEKLKNNRKNISEKHGGENTVLAFSKTVASEKTIFSNNIIEESVEKCNPKLKSNQEIVRKHGTGDKKVNDPCFFAAIANVQTKFTFVKGIFFRYQSIICSDIVTSNFLM